MVFVIVTALATTLASIFQCTPIHKAWEVTGSVPGSCINVNALFFANAGLDIFQDALIYVLPMRMLYQLQVPRRQKIALMLVFAVGGFVVITGMIRLNSLKVAQNTPDPSCKQFPLPWLNSRSNEIIDNNYGAAVWSAIECNIGVVCASLPTFKPLIDRFFPSLMGRSASTPKNSVPESSAVKKQSYKLNAGESEFELERGVDWKDLHTSNYGGESNHICRASADGKPTYHLNSSEEHLRGTEVSRTTGGIWKSTSVMVSHGQV